jgi:hypothetical protein
MAKDLDRLQLRTLWQQALVEDGAEHDVTSECAVEEGVARALRAADLDRMTPLEALTLLHELRRRLE